MLYELGLQATIAVGLWILIDLTGARGPRGAKAPVMLLVSAALLWVIGEMVTRVTHEPDQLLVGRRMIFLGASVLPIAWLWIGAAAARPGWFVRRPQLVALAALPMLVIYSALYWDPAGHFVDWRSPSPRHGPWFWLFATFAWTWSLLGTAYVLQAASRLPPGRRVLRAALCVAALLPLAANSLHLVAGPLSFDPTPLALGASGLLVRLGVFDAGVVSFLPMSRYDLLDQLATAVLAADGAGRVVYANAAARRLFDGERTLGAALAALLARARADAVRSLHIEEVPLRAPLGEAGRAVLITDRTEAQALEDRLRQVQRLEAVGALAAGMAHEIHNPLAVTVGNLALVEDVAKRLADPLVAAQLDPGLRADLRLLRESVEDAQNGAERIRRIVQNLLRLVRPRGESAPRLLDMALVAKRARALAAPALREGAIRTRVLPAPRVRGSEDALVQIVFNLLVNAVQAGGEHGEIVLEVTPARGGVKVEVLDRGPGIDEQALPLIFEPFFTTKPPGRGTGLGLAVSHALARQHGGLLAAENRAGGGAVLRLWLPSGESLGG